MFWPARHRFAAGASSNVNDSLNATIVSKAPKSRIYGMTPSGDFRVACAMNKKNEGEEYVVELAKTLNLSPGTYTKKQANKIDSFSKKRFARAGTREFK